MFLEYKHQQQIIYYMHKVRSAKYYSFILDTNPDTRYIEQIIIITRFSYFKKANMSEDEYFVGVCSVNDIVRVMLYF